MLWCDVIGTICKAAQLVWYAKFKSAPLAQPKTDLQSDAPETVCNTSISHAHMEEETW